MYLGAGVITQPIIVCLKSKRSWVNTQNPCEMKASYSSACLLRQCYCAGKSLAWKRACLKRKVDNTWGMANKIVLWLSHAHLFTCTMWVYLETDTNFTNICSFPFLKIMDIAKPLGCIPFSPFLVIPWYLQIVNIPIY